MDCSTPGSSVHGILQAGILEWVKPFPSPGDLPAQDTNWDPPHRRQILYHLIYQGSPAQDKTALLHFGLRWPPDLDEFLCFL